MNRPAHADVLQRILRRKAEEVAERAARLRLPEMSARSADAPPTRGFALAIERRIAAGQPAVIAEIKRASPSQGVIREHYDPASIAATYQAGGATCLSVLTDIDFFQGSDGDLRTARAACAIPVLRKEFIVDAWQVHESRLIGADCILLIVAALDDAQLRDYAHLAGELGMDVLLEAHDRTQLERALQVPRTATAAPLLGINNRDLRSFAVSLDATLQLQASIPQDRRLVTESGVSTRADVARLRASGVQAFLVGEAFMRADDPGAALRELFA